MINTKASIRQAIEALNLGAEIDSEQEWPVPPGAGPHPCVYLRLPGAERIATVHFGALTPETPTGARRESLVAEVEVRTKSDTWNEALHLATKIQDGLGGRKITRRTYLLNPTTENPNPADAGFVRFPEECRLDKIQDEQQPHIKACFLTWEVEVEVPVT